MKSIRDVRLLASQERFPKLWGVFQTLFGATKDKVSLISKRVHAGDIVIEIGCSTGLIARHLGGTQISRYIGVDTDEGALSCARALGLDKRFLFVTNLPDPSQLDPNQRILILISHVLHHLDDTELHGLLAQVSSSYSNAQAFILDPEKERDSYSWRYRLFYKLENGKFRRDLHEVTDLLCKRKWEVLAWAEHRAHPTILGGLHAGTMWSIDAKIAGPTDQAN